LGKPVEQIGEEIGVTGNAVRRWCKKYGIETPSRGYWAKEYAKKSHAPVAKLEEPRGS